MGRSTATVLFFGRLRELLGFAQDSFTLPDAPDAALPGATPISGIFAHYAQRCPRLAEFRGSVVPSCNREFVDWETPVHSGDEVAFLPPVSGG
jgi:molybdopterin converting factor small subunit